MKDMPYVGSILLMGDTIKFRKTDSGKQGLWRFRCPSADTENVMSTRGLSTWLWFLTSMPSHQNKVPLKPATVHTAASPLKRSHDQVCRWAAQPKFGICLWGIHHFTQKRPSS